MEIPGFHSEAGHLGHPHAQGAGGSETLFIRSRLVVQDNIVVFQPPGNLGTPGITDIDNHLVGLGIVDVRIAGHVQAAILQGQGESLGVGDDSRLIFIFEGIHFVGGHQQAQLGA